MGNRKGQSSVAVGTGIAILLLILVGLFVVFPVGETEQSVIGDGFQVTSIDYITNLGLWRVDLKLGGPEDVIGTITPSTFADQAGVGAERSLTLTAEGQEERIQYGINSATQGGEARIYAYDVIINEASKINLYQDPAPCPQGTIAQKKYEQLFQVNARVCVVKEQIGIFGALSDPSVKFRASMSLSNGQNVFTQDIDEQNTIVQFGNVASCRWIGSLVTGDPAPDLDNLRPYLLSGERWEFTSDIAFTQFLSGQTATEADILQSLVGPNDARGFIEQSEQIDQSITSQNNARTNLLDANIGRARIAQEGLTLSLPFDQNSAKLEFTADRRINVQDVVCDIEADYIGVIIRTGQPELSDISCPTVQSGQDTIITYSLENVGEERGTFQVTKTGCPSFQSSFGGISNQRSVDPGEKLTNLQLRLSAGASNTDVIENCRIRATDISDSTLFDERAITCARTPATICQAGQFVPEGTQLFQCSEDGTELSLVKNCGTNQLAFVEGAYCCPGDADCIPAPITCGEGQIQISETECGDQELICPDGTREVGLINKRCEPIVITPCPDDSINVAGQCIQIQQCKWYDIFCQVRTLIMQFLLIGGAILGVFSASAIFIGFERALPILANRKKLRRSDNVIRSILALLVGGGVFYVAQASVDIAVTIFWVGFVAFIAYGLYVLLLKR